MKTSRYRIDLIRQMADCDANYIRLLKLMPELESFRERCFQARHGHLADGGNELAVKRSAQVETESTRQNAEYAREFILSSPDGGKEQKVRISVLEVFRYTSTVSIKQLGKMNEWVDPPGILVRVYHDAATAEAVAYQGHKAFLARYEIPNSAMYHQDEKRQINEFLGEWLSLCIQAGRSLKAPTLFCTA